MLKYPSMSFEKKSPATPFHAETSKKAYLIIFTGTNNDATVISLNKTMTIGREVPGNNPDIALSSPIVSRKQGVFSVNFDGFYYEDCESFNGTFINGVLYKSDTNPCTAPIKLHDGDVIRFDSKNAYKSHTNAVTIVFTTEYDKRSKWRRHTFKNPIVPMGISGKGVLDFVAENLAFQNATLSFQDYGTAVSVNPGRNRFFYNNAPQLSTFNVKNKDMFRVDSSYVYIDSGSVLYNVCLSTQPGLSVNLAETHVADMFKKKVLLRDIYLDIYPGDFALIIGGSGAGKSTFMNSILGKYDISGSILINGHSTADDSALTSDIAYVPQTLPLRKEEKLIDVITDTCILRCKRHMNKKERTQFIYDTLASLGLKEKANMEIKKLSGGEQRRAAIANEVVTDSNIFFLDEPDSGLDPKSGMELMNNLRALSDTGKMVMLISHNYASYPNPEKIYSKIIILAKSNKDSVGRLAFSGSVKEALEFFGVDALKDITKLINPVSENGEGRADEFVEKFRRMYDRG